MSYPPPPQGPPPPYPQGQYPPPGYPPDPYGPGQYPPQEQQVRRRGGCRGCLVSCLIAGLVGGILLVAGVVAGVYAVRQMFPATESAREAATCAIIRTIVNTAEPLIEQMDATPAEKAEMRRGIQELRTEFERRCRPWTEVQVYHRSVPTGRTGASLPRESRSDGTTVDVD